MKTIKELAEDLDTFYDLSDEEYLGRLTAFAEAYHKAMLEASPPVEVEPVGWRPIETAPKDNKRPLYLARIIDGEIEEIDFDGGWEYWQESWEMSHINGWDLVSYGGIEEPTHWAYQDKPIPNTSPPNTEAKLKIAVEALKADAERLEFLINPDNVAFVTWMKRPNKPMKFRIIIDGEPETGWRLTVREAIDEARKQG